MSIDTTQAKESTDLHATNPGKSAVASITAVGAPEFSEVHFVATNLAFDTVERLAEGE